MSVLRPWATPHRARKSCQFMGPFKGTSLLYKQGLKVTVHILLKAYSQLNSHWLALDQMWFVWTPQPPPAFFLTLGILVFQLCRFCWAQRFCWKGGLMGEGEKDPLLGQEYSCELFFGSLIGSCQGRDLTEPISGHRENGCTFIHVTWLDMPLLWKQEGKQIWCIQSSSSWPYGGDPCYSVTHR